MKKLFLIFFILTFVSCPFIVSGLELSANSAVLFEPLSGRFIFEKNKDHKTGIASTTKILTAITAIENGNLEDIVTTSKGAADVEGSSIWLEEGEQQTLRDLLFGLMLASGNDASIAIAEHIGQNTESFALLMNQTAKIAGAKNSNFVNPSGLDHELHYSTAADMAKIMAYAEKNSFFRKVSATEKYEIPWEGHEYNRVINNHNRLLNMYEGCTGGKTGFTKKCGRCLVSSATQNGIHLIAVTLNAPDDWNDHIKLYDYGFSLFSCAEIFPKDLKCINYNVKNGVKKEIQTRYSENVILPTMQNDCIEIKKTWSKNNTAPVQSGAVIGYAEILLNNNIVQKVDILAAEACEKLYIPTIKDYVKALIACLF